MSDSAGNLPAQLSDFIGREMESREIRKLISDHRLVTLTGAGGSCKTRLSIKAANEFLDEFEQGIWFIRYAPLSDLRFKDMLHNHADKPVCGVVSRAVKLTFIASSC